MSDKLTKKILEELQKEHEGGKSLKHSKNFSKSKPEKRNRFFENGEIHQNQHNKVIWLTEDDVDNGKKR